MSDSSLRSRACSRAAIVGSMLLAGHAVVFAQQYAISTVAGGAPPATPAPGVSIPIGPPQRLAYDGGGNVYFTSLNSVFRLDSAGSVTLIAGNSRPGYSGDGGPATQAQLNAPQGLAVDPFGDIYIADTGNNRIRQVTPDGLIYTFAGTGQAGLYPIGGPATQSPLHSPAGVAYYSGNVYIADSGNHLIRVVTQDGNISIVAGVSYPGFAGDTGLALLANLQGPQDVAIDSKGVIYIADTGNARIRAVGADGNINTVAGSSGTGFSGDGAAATSAALSQPYALAVDAQGDIFIADLGNLRVRKVDAKGNINTVAGTGFPGFSGDGSAATKATLTLPSGVAVDGSGNVFIADQWNLRVRKVASSNITTVAGNGGFSYSGDGGPATRAQFNGPQGVAVDPSGNVFVSDSRNAVVRRIGLDHTIVTLPGTALVFPHGLAADSAGNIYVADSLDNRVKRIGVDGSVVTVAGNGSPGFAGDGGPATSAQLNGPVGVAVDRANNLYIADFANNRVREVTTDGNINTIAGNGTQTYAGDNASATLAALNGPQGVAVDAAGNVYIADTNNHAIREVTRDGNIHTAAGTGVPGFLGDGGPPTSAQITGPSAIAIDNSGNLYVTDATMRVRKIVPGLVITTIAGNGTAGYSGDGGIATLASFNGPAGIALDGSGNLYVADAANNAVRLLQAVASTLSVSAISNAASNQGSTISPGEIVVLYGSGLGPSQFTAGVPGPDERLPTAVAGSTVSFNGIPAPIIYTSPSQVSAVVPFNVGGPAVQVTARYLGQATSKNLTVAAAAPGLFTLNFTGQGQAVAFDQNQQPNNAGNPTSRGAPLTLLATGLGQTSPPGTDGLLGAAPLPSSAARPVVTIGGQPATVVSATGVPGQVAGMMQITVQIPASIQPGAAVPVTLQVSGVSAPAGVTVAVN
ncbi:MAG TPA: hypothetical protein VKT49_13730 [Bryobacteraceae bacterium]|nr:hypothetical protein [Bryobacteraceae bacterium]